MTNPLRGQVNLWVGVPCRMYNTDKSCDHKHCDSRDIIFLTSHVTSREHMFKGLYGFMGKSS